MLLVFSFFFSFLIGYFGMSFWGRDVFLKGEVLSDVYVYEGEKMVDPTPTPTPSPTPKPTKTPKPTPTPIPQPVFSSEEIHGFIERFAGQYGVDPNVLRHLAVCESGFNPLAEKLNYVGLFQFSPNTWIKYRQLMGEDIDISLRANAEEAVQTAAYALSSGDDHIWPNCAP